MLMIDENYPAPPCGIRLSLLPISATPGSRACYPPWQNAESSTDLGQLRRCKGAFRWYMMYCGPHFAS